MIQHIGWFYFFSILTLFVYLGLINFLVFLLFVYLIGDIFYSFFCKHFPSAGPRIKLFFVYFLISMIASVVVLYIIPLFISDLPSYVRKIEQAINSELYPLLSQYDLLLETKTIEYYVIDFLKQNLALTFSLIQKIGKNIFLLVLSIVICFIIQHRIHINHFKSVPVTNLFEHLVRFFNEKIAAFYRYFRTVMAAQLLISLINSVLTLLLLIILQIPHKITLTVLVFIFGLLPIIGNIISNVLICSAALIWTGKWQFIISLIFLIVIHKLEYILNGKIISHFVALPMHITLLALVIGESLFHIPGMILAIPTVLFLREQLLLVKFNMAES